jgi:hypothetical protein
VHKWTHLQTVDVLPGLDGLHGGRALRGDRGPQPNGKLPATPITHTQVTHTHSKATHRLEAQHGRRHVQGGWVGHCPQRFQVSRGERGSMEGWGRGGVVQSASTHGSETQQQSQ